MLECQKIRMLQSQNVTKLESQKVRMLQSQNVRKLECYKVRMLESQNVKKLEMENSKDRFIEFVYIKGLELTAEKFMCS